MNTNIIKNNCIFSEKPLIRQLDPKENESSDFSLGLGNDVLVEQESLCSYENEYIHYMNIKTNDLNMNYIGRYNIYLYYKQNFNILPSQHTIFLEYILDKKTFNYNLILDYIKVYFKDLIEFDNDFYINSDYKKDFWCNSYLIDKISKIIICFSITGDILILYDFSNKETQKILNQLKEDYKKALKLKPKNKKKYKISFLLSSSSGLTLQQQNIDYYNNKEKIDIQELYDLDISKIIENIKNDKSGVFIFNGDAGSGKTSLIKYLSCECRDKHFIFIPNNVAYCLSNPDMLPILINNPNCILILEDAEEIVLNKNGERSSGLATLLNIADGILGDCLKIKIIVTFNNLDSYKNIDKALLRKGRLLGQYNINELSLEKTKKLMRKLYDIDVEKSMTLANIFNYKNDINKDVIEEKTNRIGF